MCDNDDALCPSCNYTTYIMFATTKNLPIVIVIGKKLQCEIYSLVCMQRIKLVLRIFCITVQEYLVSFIVSDILAN